MCGIVGIVSQKNCLTQILDGLQRLEYRGYDSAGVAFIDNIGQTKCIKRKGNVGVLKDAVFSEHDNHLYGSIAIAHTRWATHGKVTEENAHPHQSGSISLVHNGIIENYESLKSDMIEKGYVFKSETDSEVLAHLLDHTINTYKCSLYDALQKVIPILEGAYGLLIMDQRTPGELWVARSGSPMVIGVGSEDEKTTYIASDEHSLHPYTNQFVYLDEGEIAHVTSHDFTVFLNGEVVDKTVRISDANQEESEKGEHDSYMSKEMQEQPRVIENLINHHIVDGDIFKDSELKNIIPLLKKTKHVHIVACGTSFHSGLIAKDLFESKLNISTSVEVASEYRYRQVAVPENTLFICISQSGETADTLAALKKANDSNLYLATLAICNVATSSMVREADVHFLLRAGVEIGVASTKAFTMQILAFLLIVYAYSVKVNKQEQASELLESLKMLPLYCTQAISLGQEVAKSALLLEHSQSCLFLGRGQQAAIAMEGALKLKELSYIHAEAYAAGELKHGPLALIDEDIPVIVTASYDHTHAKLASNVEEVNARGGRFIVFADPRVELKAENMCRVDMPMVPVDIASIVYAIPLQYLSYYAAILKGENVDQPRSLAKSVTTE